MSTSFRFAGNNRQSSCCLIVLATNQEAATLAYRKGCWALNSIKTDDPSADLIVLRNLKSSSRPETQHTECFVWHGEAVWSMIAFIDSAHHKRKGRMR